MNFTEYLNRVISYLKVHYIYATVSGVIIIVLLSFLGTGYTYREIKAEDMMYLAPSQATAGPEDGKSNFLNTGGKISTKARPRGVYIVIDRVHNRLELKEGETRLLEAAISAGCGSVLEDPAGHRIWTFDTPVGRFKVTNKRKNPLWVSPDWEFIEKNEPLPGRTADRVRAGMLGEYALDLNIPGYMIHGTLYSRLLGRNVTHGCIRVGRDDLRILWKRVPAGAAVFIF